MPRILERALSPTFVKTAPPGMHCDGRGLYLQVTVGKDGKLNRSWIFRYRVNGRSRDMGLGALATIGLSEARERAKARRQERLDKIDPLEARKSARAAEEVDKAKTITFDEAAGAYIEAHEAGWRNAKHASQWRNTILTYASPVLGALPVRAIDTGLVLKVIEPLWSTRRETASRVAARLWTVPANRTKRQREHRVPLCKATGAVLERVAAVRQSKCVFAGDREGEPLSPMALLIALRRMGIAFTVHGFRSSFRDWAAERTNFPREIAEAALGHVIGDETERAYQRGDLLEKRRLLMEAWAGFCAKPVGKASVTPIARGTGGGA